MPSDNRRNTTSICISKAYSNTLEEGFGASQEPESEEGGTSRDWAPGGYPGQVYTRPDNLHFKLVPFEDMIIIIDDLSENGNEQPVSTPPCLDGASAASTSTGVQGNLNPSNREDTCSVSNQQDTKVQTKVTSIPQT